MKTFEQFKEESDKFGIKKTMNNFKQNQNVQNLFKKFWKFFFISSENCLYVFIFFPVIFLKLKLLA